MRDEIEAIFLDVGNTLRIVIEDAPFQAQAQQRLMRLIGVTESVETFFAKLHTRWQAYRQWSLDNLAEVSERELWTRFMLPDLPTEKIAPLAGALTRAWRDKDGHRVPRHDVHATLRELHRRGYTLGIIANTVTETEIPDWLDQDGLTRYFKAVILSSEFGRRKPGPEIYWEAARVAGIAPARSVYVGDNPARDVSGARRAGFAMTIILPAPGKSEKDFPPDASKPDVFIQTFGDLLKIFPPRQQIKNAKPIAHGG